MTTYTNLKLTLEFEGDDYRATLEHQTKPGPDSARFCLDLDSKGADGSSLRDCLQRIRELKAGRDDLEKFGQALYEAVFCGAIGERFQTWYDDLPDETRFRLRLDIRAPKLQPLPWELLRDRKQFLARRGVSIVRFNQLAAKTDVEIRDPRVLVISSAPRGARFEFNEDDYISPIDAVWKEAGVTPKIVRSPDCTYAKLQMLLSTQSFDLVHFVGHGMYKGDKGFVYLLDADQNPVQIPGDDLADLLKAAHVKFTFLCSCRTAQTSGENEFRGVAQSIIGAGLPAVVAMQFDFSQKDAKPFVEGFYKWLLRSSSIDEAVHYARQAVASEQVAWCVPALYSQFEIGRLIAVPVRKEALAAGAGAGAADVKTVAPAVPPQAPLPNPFLNFGSPAPPERFCGRAEIIHDLIDSILQRRNTILVGERRMGKTSVLKYLTHGRIMSAYGLNPLRQIHVFYDYSALSPKTFEEFWRDLLVALGRESAMIAKQLGALGKDFRLNQTTVRMLLAGLHKTHEIVFFIDESDTLFTCGLPAEFFSFLADLNDTERVVFVISARYRPSHYMREGAMAALQFFESARVQELHPLDREALEEFVDRYLPENLKTLGASDAALLQRLSGFYPYYLHVACAKLFDIRNQGRPARDALPLFWEQVSGSLEFHWNSSDERERIMLAMLALRGQGPGAGPRLSREALETYCPAWEHTLEGLRQRGLVQESNGRVALFCRSFEAYILGSLADPSGDDSGQESYQNWYQLHFNHQLTDDFDTEDLKKMCSLFCRVKSEHWEVLTKWCRQARHREHAISLLLMLPQEFTPSTYLQDLSWTA